MQLRGADCWLRVVERLMTTASAAATCTASRRRSGTFHSTTIEAPGSRPGPLHVPALVELAERSPPTATGEDRHAADQHEADAERRQHAVWASEGQPLLGGARLGGLRSLAAGKDRLAVERTRVALAGDTVTACLVVAISGARLRVKPVRVRGVGAKVPLGRGLRGEVRAVLVVLLRDGRRGAQGEDGDGDGQCQGELAHGPCSFRMRVR